MVAPVTARRNNAERQQRQQRDGFHSVPPFRRKNPHSGALLLWRISLRSTLLLRRIWQPFVRRGNRRMRELFGARGSVSTETTAA